MRMTSNLVGEVIKNSSDLIPTVCLWLLYSFCVILYKSLAGLTWNLVDELIMLFPGLWLVKSLYGIPQAWLTFGHAPLNSNFLPFDLFSCFHAFAYKAYKPLDGLTSNLVDELIIGLNQTWLTFGPTLLSSCHFLTSEWWRSFWISILLFKFTVPNKILKCWDTVAKIAEHYRSPWEKKI